jgi:protein-disulfide isomerase
MQHRPSDRPAAAVGDLAPVQDVSMVLESRRAETFSAAMPAAARVGRAARYLVGQILLLAALGAAAMLVWQHLSGLSLPGCGPLSECAQLAAGRWGNVLGWPVSFLGVAWFAALAVCYGWTGWRRAVPGYLKWNARLGSLGSFFFLGVMLIQRHFCPYCLAVHLSNLAFVALLESIPRATVARRWPAVASATVFVLVSAALGLGQEQVTLTAQDAAEKQFAESLEQIVQRVRQQNQEPADAGVAGAGGLTGRWQLGPERAAIRLVMFADDQCRHCAQLEMQVEAVMAKRADVSLVIKHYPLCKQCNRQIKLDQLHEQACRAATLAETAGLLGGNDGFWRMHQWLKGNDLADDEFTDAKLKTILTDLHFDPDAFLAAMKGSEVSQRIKDDIEEAIGLGIETTPMVFVDGVELAHPEVEDSVARAIAAVSRENPRPRTDAGDRPRSGGERLLAEWLADKPCDLSSHRGRWTLGPATARHRVVLIMCHANEYSPRFSQNVRDLAVRRGDVRVEFWHYPMTKQCNRGYARVDGANYPRSYAMALVAEAAGRLGGNEAFWKMHLWLLDHQKDFSLEAAQQAGRGFGLNAGQLAAEVKGPAVREAVDSDSAACETAEIRGAPQIYIADRFVPSANPTQELFDRILERIDEQ